jgi:two-component system, NtrC family, sensor kinase
VSSAPKSQTEQLLFLEQLKEQWMAMIDSVQDPLVILNEKFEIQRQNLAYFEMSALFQSQNSVSIRSLKNKKCFEVFAGRTSPCQHCKVHSLQEVGSSVSWSTQELTFSSQENEKFHFDIQAKKLPGNGYVVHYRNVTEIKLMQEGLARADKLSALGHMAGGVAHEINSPLAGILAFSQMALSEMDESNQHYSDLREIEDAARKCKLIVEGMLGFARQDKPADTKRFSIVEAIESTIRLATPLTRKQNVEVEFARPRLSENFQVQGQMGKLEQVLLNLITNASHAMRVSGGTVSIWLEETPSEMFIFVQDCGEGISPKALPRIFDPFYTTKPYGEGTGLGLSVSYSHIKQMGGRIEVKSEMGEGTLFQIVLPILN